jgi:hypothetical protein
MHVAESTHWYDRAGKPAYTVAAKNGNQRPTTLRDARKLGLVPSVTTIIKCAAAPALEIWKQNQVLMAALTLPRGDGEGEADWLVRVGRDSKETARKAAERGTAIHAAIQGAYEWVAYPEEFKRHVNAAFCTVSDWHSQIVGSWTPERSFSHPMGFGGKCDLSCDNAVLDFKTKEFGPDDKLQTWDEHAMQLAAYRVGLGMPTSRCAIVYVSVNNPGLARALEIPADELDAGWKMFQGLLSYWQAKTGYRSAFKLEAA